VDNYEAKKFESNRADDLAREYDRVTIDAAAEPRFWGIAASDAASYFKQSSDKLFRDIARNYYDEAEIGRIAKEFFRDAIGDSLVED
jgi:hypothetical protein